MNPFSIRFILEVLLLGVHMQVTLEVSYKDLKSNEHLDEAVLFFRRCQRLQCCLANDVVTLGVYIYIFARILLGVPYGLQGIRCFLHHRVEVVVEGLSRRPGQE